MQPSDFRQLEVEKGTLVGLIGEYNAPSDWTNGEVIKGILLNYVVVERHDLILDTSAIIKLHKILTSQDYNFERFEGGYLLLLHRYHDSPWSNNDPNVYVYGIQDENLLNHEVLMYEVWNSKVTQLSSAAIMTVEDIKNPSEMARAYWKKANRNLKN
jgi:hypothetical protein